MTGANDAGLVRVGAWMLGSAAVLMAVGSVVEAVRFLALPSYMLGALGLMVLGWAASEAQWIRDRPWVRRVGAGVMLLIGASGVAVVIMAVASAAGLLVSGQDTWANVLGWLVFYSPIVGAASLMLVPGWRLVKVDRQASQADRTQEGTAD